MIATLGMVADCGPALLAEVFRFCLAPNVYEPWSELLPVGEFLLGSY